MMPTDFIALIFGGLSALASLISLNIQTKRTNFFRDLKRELLDQAKVFKERNELKDEEAIYELLSFGSLLLPFLKEKLVIRFWVTLTIIIASVVAIIQPGESSVIKSIPNFQVYDFIFIGIQFYAALINNTSLFLDPEEGKFLKNSKVLKDWYYENIIYPRINEFNVVAEKVKSLVSFRAKNEIDESRLKEVIEKVLNERLEYKESSNK